MKKNRDAESSLELLLDTMCNTFGGVMFIAIALIVVLSIASKIKTPDFPEEAKPELTQERLEQLRQELENLKNSNASRLEMLEILKNDPRRALLEDVIRLEEQQKKLEQEQKEKSGKVTALSEKNRILQEQQVELKKELRKTEEQTHQAKILTEQQKKEIMILQEELKKIVSGHITFKTLAKSDKAPYFLIVFNNRIWRIGPDRIGDDPHSDVEFNISGNQVACRINKAIAGVPLLEGGHISPAARELLEEIPDNRFPDFSLHSNSVADFFIFREELKNEKVSHSINTFFESNNETYYYRYANQTDYEAY